MTPAAVELAIEIRREVEARYEEADQLRCRAIERAQVDADLAQRRFMLVDPGNRLVADTLESDWNEKLRTLAKARDERDRARREDRIAIDDAIRDRLVAMTTDFGRVWSDPSTPNRERKRLLAYLVEDVTLLKLPAERTTRIHVRFRGGQTTTLTTVNPKASWEKVKTRPEIVDLVDQLLDHHVYDEIADILNERGLRPGGAAWPGRGGARFTAGRVEYIAHAYGLRPRLDRLRARGLRTKKELAARLRIHESTLTSWVRHGIIRAHAYNGHAWLYEEPSSRPVKHCSRWDRLTDRAAAIHASPNHDQGPRLESQEAQCEDGWLWQSQKPWPSYTRSFTAVRRLLRKTKTMPPNGSAASPARQTWARPSIPRRKSVGSIATSTRICGVIWIMPRGVGTRPPPAPRPPRPPSPAAR